MVATPMTLEPKLSASPWNVPNLLTLARLCLSFGVIGCIELRMWWVALVSFTIAAATDWADGYYARKYGQVTKLGRIFDPFVDKMIICGTYIALVSIPEAKLISAIAILVTARELLVTSLRGMIEGAGGDFSARWLGKWKMVAQCAAAIVVLLALALGTVPAWLEYLRIISLTLVVILTIWSGVDYVGAAAKVLRRQTMQPLEESLRNG